MKLTRILVPLAVLYAAAFLPVLGQAPLPALVLVLSAGLAVLLVALSTIDAVWLALPNLLTVILAASGLIATLAVGTSSIILNLASALCSGALFLGVNAAYRSVRGRNGLGGGDVKFVAAAVVWIGPWGLPTMLLWACVTAIGEVVVRLGLSQRLSPNSRIPFGPHLAFGTWLVWLYGPLQ